MIFSRTPSHFSRSPSGERLLGAYDTLPPAVPKTLAQLIAGHTHATQLFSTAPQPPPLPKGSRPRQNFARRPRPDLALAATIVADRLAAATGTVGAATFAAAHTTADGSSGHTNGHGTAGSGSGGMLSTRAEAGLALAEAVSALQAEHELKHAFANHHGGGTGYGSGLQLPASAAAPPASARSAHNKTPAARKPRPAAFMLRYAAGSPNPNPNPAATASLHASGGRSCRTCLTSVFAHYYFVFNRIAF